MEFDFNTIGAWLDLTSQEFEILKSIYRIQIAGKRASPTEINVDYAQDNKRTIQKQNLHKILRKLVEGGFVARRAQGDYRVSLAGVRSNLEGEVEKKSLELSAFKQVVADVEGEFRRQLAPADRPRVEYLDGDVLYPHMARLLDKAGEFNIVASFPSIAYPPSLAAKLGRSEYSSVLASKSLAKTELSANFLTDLDVDYLFVHCFRVVDSPAGAFKLALTVLNNLEAILDSDSSVDVRYHPDPHGLDVAIPSEKDGEPKEFYLFTRDEHKEIAGAIYVRNPESSRNAQHAFRRNFDYAETKLEKHLTEAREKLKQKYGILEK